MSVCLHNLFIGYANLFISAQHAVKAPHHPLLPLSHSIGMQQFFFLTAAALSRLFRYLSSINFIPKQQRVTSVYYSSNIRPRDLFAMYTSLARYHIDWMGTGETLSSPPTDDVLVTTFARNLQRSR